ncbi:MAG: histidinol dehydrogenase [Bacteroidales bacterium]|nr:histidinol dehydrogenase [Bacteroidales bacterium]
MDIVINPPQGQWKGLCSRVVADDAAIEGRVRAILDRVRTGGDAALVEITREVEGREMPSGVEASNPFLVSSEQIAAAANEVGDAVKEAIAAAAANIRAFHSAQKPAPVEVETMPGVRCMRRSLPIERVGLYIPGGSAPLFSTLLMLAIPAKNAGCREIVLCTPAGRDGKVAPSVLYAASVCGVDTIYSLGGAQTIAAMAFGTETIAPVNKIFGPGNRYVTKAKQLVAATGVAIDMPAGPSEVMVMADDTADVRFVASDLLSQAEHGPDSQAILVCKSSDFAAKVQAEVDRQLALLPRRDIAQKALGNSRIVVMEDHNRAVAFANAYASEHLIIATRNPWDIAEKITAAGSVFIGHYSPESAGDYASGTNHTLPTMGLASAWSGIGLDSFMHSITYQELTREGLASLGKTITTMAEAEGLDAHAAAVRIRLER